MDADWQTVQGSNPAAGADPNAPADGGDWRAQLDPESRSWIVSRIFEVLKRHLPVSVPEGVNELQKIAVRFEEKIYTAATSQPDYMRKISLKMLSMETKSQQAPGNAQPDYMRKISLKMLSMETKSQQAPGNAQAEAAAGTFSISIPSRPKQYTQIADPNHERQLAASARVQLPAAVDLNAPDPAGDWRAQLDPESRSRIVFQIVETLKKHLPVSVPEGLNELQKIAVRFEEKIYTAATSQADYMRKISMKLLSMDAVIQQAPGNAQVIPYQYYPN